MAEEAKAVVSAGLLQEAIVRLELIEVDLSVGVEMVGSEAVEVVVAGVAEGGGVVGGAGGCRGGGGGGGGGGGPLQVYA